MELRGLRHFVAVADARSFTTASLELRLSQPALSQSIQRLERELECTLFLRNKQNPGAGLLLTPAGESLYSDAVAILVAAHRAQERATRAGHRLERPPVAVGFTSSTPQWLVNAALAASADGVDIVPVQLEWGHEHEAISSGLVDLAYLQYPPAAAFPGHEVARIALVPRAAVLAAGHPLAASGGGIRIGELAGEPILDPGFVDGPEGFREYWLGGPRPSSAPAGRVVGPPARTVEEMCTFVAAGRGYAIASEVLAAHYHRPDIVFVPIVDLAPIEVGVARLSEDHRPPVKEIFATLAALGPGYPGTRG